MSNEPSGEPFDRNLPPPPTLEDSIEDALPRVARPPDRMTLAVILLASVALGMFVFVLLSEGRMQQQTRLTLPPPAAPVVVVAPPPAPAAVPEPPAAPAPAPQLPPPPLPRPLVTEAPMFDTAQAARWKSPSLILDLSLAPAPAAAPPNGTPGAPGGPAPVTPIIQALTPPGARAAENLTPDELFAQRFRGDDAEGSVKATRIANLSTTMQQGATITAVLETAINSDLPGYARAVVSREARSFDGSKVLVPRGSHVVGQYRSGIALGQSRVFVVWTRLIRPDGVSIGLASDGTDDLGRGGLQGDVNRHFMQRFGSTILLSLLSLTGQALSDNNTQVVINSTQAASNSAGVALQEEIRISPTIEVPAGTPLRIFVARDLDFSTVEDGR